MAGGFSPLSSFRQCGERLALATVNNDRRPRRYVPIAFIEDRQGASL